MYHIRTLFKNWRQFLQKEYELLNKLRKKCFDQFQDYEMSHDAILQRKYSRMYEDYWIPVHRARRFHLFNDIRAQFIYNVFHQDEKIDRIRPKEKFCDLKMLVVGCSGGILTESMAELNFNVTGVDLNPHFIVIAKHHQEENKLLRGKRLNYVRASIEEFAPKNSESFDAVVISNVLEYDINFWNKRDFLKCCVDCCKPGGHVLVTTMDSSLRTLLWSVHFDHEPLWNAANHRWYRGTNPAVLQNILKKFDCRTMDKRGIQFLPFESKFVPDEEIRTWYFLHAIKGPPKICDV